MYKVLKNKKSRVIICLKIRNMSNKIIFKHKKEDDCIYNIRRIWNILMNFIITIEVILVIIFLAPNLLGIKTFVVTSGSMEQIYPTGSLIYVKKVDPKEIQVGDSITFYLEDSTIVATHQVYEINKDAQKFRTQGVNNRDENGNIIHDGSPVSFSSLIGKPVICIKYLGYLNRWITTPPGMYIVLIITSCIILISLILDKYYKITEAKKWK